MNSLSVTCPAGGETGATWRASLGCFICCGEISPLQTEWPFLYVERPATTNRIDSISHKYVIQ